MCRESGGGGGSVGREGILLCLFVFLMGRWRWRLLLRIEM